MTTSLNSDDFRIYLYDYYVKLRNSLNRIKQLQLFTIDDYSVDYNGNQWFLYKPKYEWFLKTEESLNVYNVDNDENFFDDIDLNEIKKTKQITNYKKTFGELWVRLKNFPFAFPIALNTSCIIKQQLWKQMLEGEIIKFNVFENFGFILYQHNTVNYITFFTIEQQYKRNEVVLNKDILDKDIIDLATDKYGNVGTVLAIDKTILINPLKTFKFNYTDTFIDCISYNGNYYVFYHDDKIVQTNSIKVSKVDSTEGLSVRSNIAQTMTVNLPKYDIRGTNICTPTEDTNWAISISADNINIAYESIPSQ